MEICENCPGCRTRDSRVGICCWAQSGAITSVVGLVWPIWLMIWNAFLQCFVGFFCGCGLTVGQVESCLFPVWLCSKVPCACGSCSVLSTTWVNLLTFAGFTGAWYLFIGDLVIVAGLVLFAITLGVWIAWCINQRPVGKEASLVDEDEDKSLMAENIDLEANTGELKF